MADSYEKKEREKKRRKRKQDKRDKLKQKKSSDSTTEEFMYVDENGNLSPTPPDSTKKTIFKIEDIEISIPKSLTTDENKFLKTGFLKFYNQEKSYGFIEETNTRTNYFVHADHLLDDIKENDKVEFEVGSGPKGPIAVKVKRQKVKKVENEAPQTDQSSSAKDVKEDESGEKN